MQIGWVIVGGMSLRHAADAVRGADRLHAAGAHASSGRARGAACRRAAPRPGGVAGSIGPPARDSCSGKQPRPLPTAVAARAYPESIAMAPGDPVMPLILGSNGQDDLKGTSLGDALFGFGDRDVLEPGAGADLVDGGDGFDFAFYDKSPAAIRIDFTELRADGGMLARGGDARRRCAAPHRRRRRHRVRRQPQGGCERQHLLWRSRR